MKKYLPVLIILIYLILTNHQAYASGGEDFYLYSCLDAGFGFPAGKLLRVEEKLLEANREEFSGVNYYHSFNFDFKIGNALRFARTRKKDYYFGLQGLIGYYDIMHKAEFDYNKDSGRDHVEKETETLLSFWRWMAGPALFVSFDKKENDTGFAGHTIFVLFGKIFTGELESLPMGQNRPEFKTDLKGRCIKAGYGFTAMGDGFFFNMYLAYTEIWLELEELPAGYAEEDLSKDTTISDISLGFGFGISFN